MEQIAGISRNLSFVLGVTQKSSTWDAVNFQKFIEDKGFRPSNDIARNASIEESNFHKKLLAFLDMELKLKMQILNDILSILREILRKIGSFSISKTNQVINNKWITKKVSIMNVSTTNMNIASIAGAKESKEEESWLKKIGDKVLDKILEKIIDKAWDKLFGKDQTSGLLSKVWEAIKGAFGKSNTNAGREIAEGESGALRNLGGLGDLLNIGKYAKGLAVAGTVIGLLGSGIAIKNASPQQRGKVIAGEAGGWAGTIAGGAIGSAFGGVGAIPGAIIGSFAGEMLGKWLYSNKQAWPKVGGMAGMALGSTFGPLGAVVGGFTGSAAGNWLKDQKNITAFLNSVKDKFSSFGDWLSSNWKKIVVTLLTFLGPIGWNIMIIIANIRTHWDSIKEKAQAIWGEIKNIINAVAEEVQRVWDNVTKWLSDRFSGLIGLIDKITSNPMFKKVAQIGDKGLSILTHFVFGEDGPPGYSTGLPYVPFDGYIAELHKGERVLTASENRAYSNPPRTFGSSTVNRGGNTFNISINGVNKSTDEIIGDLLNRIAEAVNTMGEVAF